MQLFIKSIKEEIKYYVRIVKLLRYTCKSHDYFIKIKFNHLISFNIVCVVNICNTYAYCVMLNKNVCHNRVNDL